MTKALQFIGAGLLFTVLAAPALATEGAGMLEGTEKLHAKGCGKEKVETVLLFALFSDGKWTASDESAEYSGTWSYGRNKNSSKKGLIQFDFKEDSLDTLRSVLGERVSAMCGEPVVVTTAIRKKFHGKVKNGKARIKMKFDLTGEPPVQDEEEFVQGKGKWKLKAKGSFTEATP